MRNQRSALRWRLALTLVVGAFFALGTFWLVQVMERSGAQLQGDARRNEPDYFVERFSFVRMSKTGQPSYLISGTRLTHHPLDDSSDVLLPYVRSVAPGQPPMNVRSESAHIDQGNSRVQLTGKVKAERPAGPGLQRMTLNTPALTIYPDLDRMETDQPVEMQVGPSLLTGTGMLANNATGRIDIAHRLHITYPPAPR